MIILLSPTSISRWEVVTLANQNNKITHIAVYHVTTTSQINHNQRTFGFNFIFQVSNTETNEDSIQVSEKSKQSDDMSNFADIPSETAAGVCVA